eukprot:1559514-Prymnesium_polylepis.1
MRPPQYRLSSLSLRKCRSREGAQPRPRAARRLAAFGLEAAALAQLDVALVGVPGGAGVRRAGAAHLASPKCCA